MQKQFLRIPIRNIITRILNLFVDLLTSKNLNLITEHSNTVFFVCIVDDIILDKAHMY